MLPYLFWESKPARIIALGSVVAFLYIVVNNFGGFSSPLWWVGNPAQFWYMAQQTVFALAGVGLVAQKPDQNGKAITMAAMVETYAILALLITILALTSLA